MKNPLYEGIFCSVSIMCYIEGMKNMEQRSGGEMLREDSFAELTKKVDETEVVVYERLNATNTKQAKEEFLADESLEKPNNVRGNLDPDLVAHNLEELEEAKQELAEKGDSMSSKQKLLVEMLIDDHTKKNEFLAANIAYNEAATPEEKEKAAEMHRETNEALYGKIDETTFYTLLKRRISDVKIETPEDQAKLDELMGMIGVIPEEKLKPIEDDLPSKELVERFSEVVNAYYGNFLEYVPSEEEKPELTSDEVVDIMNTILENELSGETFEPAQRVTPEGDVYELDYDNVDGGGNYQSAYRAATLDGITAASVNHQQRLIKFPKGKTYTNKRARQLILHEMGTHAMRADVYADGQALESFSTEVPGSEAFDEGVAKALESTVNGEFDFSGSSVEHYINIGLATFKGFNFRDLFKAQTLLRELHGEGVKTVYPRVQRALRGTDELPNNKDLAYYNGEVQIWKFIGEHIDEPDILMDNLFLMGKTDPQNPIHETLAYELRTRGSI